MDRIYSMNMQNQNQLLSIVNVGSDGTFSPTGDYFTKPSEIDHFFQHAGDNDPGKIAIHFHGGLVNESNGRDVAERMNNVFKTAGCQPITFAWETGLLETLSDNFLEIRKTELFKELLKIAIKILLKKLGLDVGGRGVKSLPDNVLDKELQKDDPFADYRFIEGAKGPVGRSVANEKSLLNSLEAELEEEFACHKQIKTIVQDEVPKTRLIDKDKLAENEKNKRRGIFTAAAVIKNTARIAFRVIKRHVEKRDHGFYPTVIEEILREFYIADLGAWFWKGMKDKSVDMFRDNHGREGEELYAGTYFLEKLDAFCREHPDTTVDLTGHSAGSIAICNLVKTAAASFQNIKIRHIIFLAPACRCDLFYREICLHPERFETFRMFTMSDEHETCDSLVPVIYTRSLLYFIAGLLEEGGDDYDHPILGLQIHSEAEAPYDFEPLLSIREFLTKQGAHRVVYSVTDPQQDPGFNTTSGKHGDFDNDTPTLESIAHILGR
ncbi:MAG: hypothetical protein GY757_56570 [bacterium]|nr:hypothetical protein [bacterium]